MGDDVEALVLTAVRYRHELRVHCYRMLASRDGETLDYVYDLDGDILTIWGGHRGSPAHYRATFDAEGTTLSGEWVWPGGSYHATQTRVR